MAIAGLDQIRFKEILKANLTPARAIKDPEHLRGRAAMLRTIDRALNSPGRHVFVFGDRGVGKTSLAQSAAVLHQSSDGEPVVIACDGTVSFFQLVQDMARGCLPPKEIDQRKTSRTLKVAIPGVSYELVQGIEAGVVPRPSTINECVSLLKIVCGMHSKEPVLIIDEFDQLTRTEDKKSFADLIKQVSDQEVPLRIIFCGIGSALEELIGTHLSTDRYLTPVPLERLSHDARWEIIRTAAQALGVSVPKELEIRIGQISDGFPYYVHLICEMMFWSLFDDQRVLPQCESNHYGDGIRGAVSEAQTSLRHAYDSATQKYSDDYQEVLWAVADSVHLRRQVSEIFDTSYVRIMRERENRKILTKEQFYNRMNALKTDRHGRILTAKGAGWYEFRENVVRGYVRLRAAAR